MAFGLFGNKNDYANIIFTGGTFNTMDPENPIADAVAVKDGVILRVGTDEDMEDIVGEDTEVFDLDGLFVFPGFIEANDTPVLDMIDEEVCLVLGDFESMEEIRQDLKDYIYKNPEDEVYFGYGFKENILAELTLEEQQELLDEICPDKPVVLLSSDGITGWFNTPALEEAAAVAEENGTGIVTLPLMLQALSPIDPFRLEYSAGEVLAGYCREGYTAIFEGNAPSFLCHACEDLMLEMAATDAEVIRYINGIFLDSEVEPAYVDQMIQNKITKFSELGGLMMGGILCPHVEDENLSSEYLSEIMALGQTRGCLIHIEAQGPGDLEVCRSAIADYREKAGSKAKIVLAHNGDTADPHTHLEFSLYVETSSVKEALETRTTLAAAKLGLENVMGSIAEGKVADFACFEEAPLAGSSKKLPNAAMTVLGGKVVYDEMDEETEEMKLGVMDFDQPL